MENITLRVALKHNGPTTITTRERNNIFWMENLKAICFSHSTASHWLKNILWHRLLLTSRAFVWRRRGGKRETKANDGLNNFLGRQHQKINPFHQLITHVPIAETFSYLHKILWMRCLHCSCIGQIPITMISTCSESFPDGFLSEMRIFPAHRSHRGALFNRHIEPSRATAAAAAIRSMRSKKFQKWCKTCKLFVMFSNLTN